MSDESGRPSMPRSLWVSLGLLVVVTVAAVIWGLDNEERDLGDRAAAALGEQSVTVDFAGRDARITGEVATPADADRAIATVRQVRGVRRVDGDSLTIAAPETPTGPVVELAPPAITIDLEDGKVVVSGTVPDQATADAIIRGAETRWGVANVEDRIFVDENTAGAAWLSGIVRAIDGVGPLEEGALTVGATGAIIEGTVGSAELRAAIEQRLAQAFGSETAIENRLAIVSLGEPSFEAELLDDGTVRLRGLMPDQATIDAIVAGAAGVYGSASVIDEMTIGDALAAPDYLSSLPAMFGAIEGLRPWQISVENRRAVITGLAVGEGAIEATMLRLTTTLGAAGLQLDNQLEIDSGAIAIVLTELLKGTATFQIGSAALSTEATVLLDEAIEILQDNPTTVLIVEGHTDDVGSDADNLELSEARAQAVVDYLVAGGVDAARLTAIGYGESRPIADNDTAEGRAENRRIQFVVEEGDNE